MRKEKALLLHEIKDKIDGSSAMIITRYEKLEPNVSWQLRHQLAKSGGFFEVVRKQVFMKAAALTGFTVDASLLDGHIGVIFVGQTDAMPSTKLIYRFSEENGKIFQVLCGKVEGKFVPGSDLEALSKLPGLEGMRAILLGLLVSPLSQTLSVMEAFMASSEQKSE